MEILHIMIRSLAGAGSPNNFLIRSLSVKVSFLLLLNWVTFQAVFGNSSACQSCEIITSTP